MTFWIVTSLMAAAAAFLIALALLRSRSDAAPAAAYDLQVYRDQLKDVDRDLARGVIGAEDADRIRTEVSRRILAADAQMQMQLGGGGQPRSASMVAAIVLGVALIGGSLIVYRALGAPGYGDLSLAQRIEQSRKISENRPPQAEAEARMPAFEEPALDASYKDLITRLRETVVQRPDDRQGLALLARHEANLGNYIAAYQAKARLIDLMGEDATAMDHAELAELMIAATGGYVSPEAEAVLRQTLSRDPWYGPGRYYWGLMLIQNDRPDLAFRIWEQTLRAGPPNAPWNTAIREQIGEAAWRAGVEYEVPAAPTALPGPSAEDMQAAQDMDAQDRQAMIQSMVDGLAERLATEGGSAEEWARLIGALGVLGDRDRAQAIYAEAQQVFAEIPDALAAITAAAQQAGLSQ